MSKNKMGLSDYDDKCVRIILEDGSVFEGACLYQDAEFNEAEIGRAKDCLAISGWLFFEDDIEKIDLIDEDHPFLGDYGRIEEETLSDGIDYVKDALFSEEPRNVYRLLRYLEDHPDLIDDKEEMAAALGSISGYYADDALNDLLRKLSGSYRK